MLWHQPIDIYCERLDTSFWSEPINAITNLAFIIASFLAFRLHMKSKQKHPAYLFMTFLLFCIGVGSFLFHTFANTWSELADTIPIWSFVFFYVMFAIRYIFNKSWTKTALIMVFVFVGAYLGLTLAHTDGSSEEVVLNGSLQYAPALFFMGVFTFALYLRRAKLVKYGFYALILFTISLTFRTVDMEVCSNIFIGSHFIWHILNAVMLYTLLYILNQALKYKYRIEED